MNQKKIFSFGVLTYNQEKIVIETLESIKYQIENYGNNYIFNIFVTDDSSTDATSFVVKRWLDENEKLFNKLQLITNNVNRGTVANFNTIMEYIGNEPFKILAGDDLIGPNNIFNYIGDNPYNIYTFPFLRLEGDKIKYRKRYLYDYFYKMKRNSKEKNIRWMRLGDFMHTPSTFYLKSLYELGNVRKFNQQFYLFEDDPSFYSMFKNVRDIEVCFGAIPLILYRYSMASTSTVPNNRFLMDWKKLQKIYIEESKGIEKLYLKLRIKSNYSRKITIFKLIERLRQLSRIIYVEVISHKDFKKFSDEIIGNIDLFDDFYKQMHKKNVDFQEMCYASN